MSWKPKSTAPKDGRTIKVRCGKWAPYHISFSGGIWGPIEYNTAGHRFTHWWDDSDEQHTDNSTAS